MMESHEVKWSQRLREEQNRVIEQTNERLAALNKFRDDYKVLQQRLETLPHKLTHDVMVPFGKLAFMEGQLIHTNEVMVLLGDNWFVDRSAHQACEIIDRRMAAIDHQMEELEQQRGLLEPRVHYTEQLFGAGAGESMRAQEGVVDLREEYDAERERLWKEEHRRKVREYRQQERREREAAAAAEKRKKEKEAKELTDEQLWRRLDELELKERREREMEKLEEELQQAESEETQEDRTSPLKPSVQEHSASTTNQLLNIAKDEDQESAESDQLTDELTDDSDDYEEEELVEMNARPKMIRFSHTATQGSVKQTSSTSPVAGHITSPADIYSHFGVDSLSVGPRSILKESKIGAAEGAGTHPQAKRVTITEPEPSKQPSNERRARLDQQGRGQQLRTGLSATSAPATQAFTGSVVERSRPDLNPAVSATEPNPPTQKISKFKAQRMRQQNR